MLRLGLLFCLHIGAIIGLYSQVNYMNTIHNQNGKAQWFTGMAESNGGAIVSSSGNISGIWDFGLARIDADGILKEWNIRVDSGFSTFGAQITRIDGTRFAMAIQSNDLSTDVRNFRLVVVDSLLNTIIDVIHDDPDVRQFPQNLCYSNGRIVATGSRTINGDQDIYIVAWDTVGNFLWDRAISRPGLPTRNENSYAILPVEDGGFIVGGYRDYLDPYQYPNQNFRWFLAKVDSNGSLLWFRINGGSIGKGYCLGLLPGDDGTFYGIGFKQVVAGGIQNFPEWRGQLMKFDRFGYVIFDSLYQYQGYRKQALRGGIMLHNGDMVLIGGLENDNTGKDYAWLLKVDSEGNQIWSRRLLFSETHHNYLRDIVQTPDGGFLMVGSVLVSPNDAWVVKVDSMGCLEPGCHLGTGTGPQYTGPAVQLYPNPVQHTLTIALSEGVHQASAIITNISGQVVFASNHSSGTQSVSTIGWPAGIYLVQVATDAGLWHGKVVKVE